MAQPDESIPQVPSDALELVNRFAGRFEIHAKHRSSGETRSLSVDRPYAIMGRAASAGVWLDDPSVSQCHAYLQLVDGLPYCIDLGSRTGVLWDDGGQGRGWIYPGQTVRIGMFDVQITGTGVLCPDPTVSEGREPGAPDAPPVTLECYTPTGSGGAFTVDQPVTLIGRHPACNLRFLDEAVAYFQCAVVKTQGTIWCVDVLSRRGTVVNGRLARAVQVRDGDLIELGKISLLLRVGAPSATPLAVFSPGAIRPLLSQSPDPVNAVITPVREMMEQFQQCFVTMARMFTTMHQEHTAMMCEQMRQIQDLLRESREAPQKAPAIAPAAPSVPPAPPKPPTTSAPLPDESLHSAAAHAWFLDRLTQKSPPPNNKPKRD